MAVHGSSTVFGIEDWCYRLVALPPYNISCSVSLCSFLRSVCFPAHNTCPDFVEHGNRCVFGSKAWMKIQSARKRTPCTNAPPEWCWGYVWNSETAHGCCELDVRSSFFFTIDWIMLPKERQGHVYHIELFGTQPPPTVAYCSYRLQRQAKRLTLCFLAI